MKVKYITNKEHDEFMVFYMLTSQDPLGAVSRAESMGLTQEYYTPIINAKKYDEVAERIKTISDARYSEHKEYLQEQKRAYQREWDKIGSTFSDEIERLTGLKWKYPEYSVVCSVFHPGISTSEFTVVRWVFEGPKQQLRITAHEILMSHIWNYFETLYPKKEVNDDINSHYWALNEITTIAILSLEPSLNKLWTKDLQDYDKYDVNYSQLNDIKFALKDMYLEKNSFKSFITEAMNYVKDNFKPDSN